MEVTPELRLAGDGGHGDAPRLERCAGYLSLAIDATVAKRLPVIARQGWYGSVQYGIMLSESVLSGSSALLTLQRATHATLQILAAQLVDLDLTSSEINALANLADGQGRTVSALGAAMGIRPTTLTGVLDRLERRGHITRGARSGDRRAVLIELTASGHHAATTICQAMTDLTDQAVGDLPAEVIEGFHRVLHALIEASA